VGLLPVELPAPLARACLLARAGQTTAALRALEEARAGGEVASGSTAMALLTAETVDCRLARGDLGAAMALGDELLPRLEQHDLAAGIAHHAHGELAAALQESEKALHHFVTAGQLAAGAAGSAGSAGSAGAAGADGADAGSLPWRVGAALASVRLGHRVEAARLAREQLELAGTGGSPYALALALRTLATTTAGVASLTLLRRARTTLAGLPTGRLTAQVDTDLAGLLVLTGGGAAAGDEALMLLRRAEEYAAREELWPLQGRVRRLLDRLGASHRPSHAEALAVLTRTERRVARLAADGLTNRAIAGQLDVGVKAVEWHLSRVYRKLGIASRTRLAAALGPAPV